MPSFFCFHRSRLSLVVAFILGLPALATAQSGGGDASGTITGFVVDAGTGTALQDASVVIEPTGDVTVVRPSESGVFLGRGSGTITGADGGYRFSGLNPGAYRLRVRHLGYREAVIDLDLSAKAPFAVSVGLVVTPIRLEPMGVVASASPFGRTRTSFEENMTGRVDAETFRHNQFLESDARVLTYSDVSEAVTLGESDLLRALQRLPGVSSRDDYMAGLWTRGAPWGQTRSYYDGLPLFNPVHALGLLSGMNPDAVGIASFHPGVRTAAIGEGAAGVLNLESRSAERSGLHGTAEVSVTSARGALESESQGGRLGLIVSARRSYVDAATRLAQLAGGDSAVYVPYSFMDLTLRADARLGRTTHLMASGFSTEDDIDGTVRHLLRDTRGRWGNRVARLAGERALGGARLRASVGVSRFDALINPPVAVGGYAAAPAFEMTDAVPQHTPTSNALTVLTTAFDLIPVNSQRSVWGAGAQFSHYQQSFSGPYPRPYPVTVLPDTLFLNRQFGLPALWAERRWHGPGRLAVETGIRVEAPGKILNVPQVAFAPRLSMRYTILRDRLALSAALGRSWQYTQALAPAGPSVGPDLYLTDVWLLSSDTIPAIRSDVATAGAEWSWPSGWIATITGYARRATGVAVPDPSPGVLNDHRPIFVSATNQARGIEAGVRRILGRTTASLSYTLAGSTLQARGFRYPSPADRRQVLDATAMYRATPGFRIGGAFTVASGAPYSRFILVPVACDTLRACSTDSLVADRIELPNAIRTAAYASLDLLMDVEGGVGRARIGAFLQLRNVLNRPNAVTYTGSLEQCVPSIPTRVEARPGVCDQFDRGVPFLPLAGVRILF